MKFLPLVGTVAASLFLVACSSTPTRNDSPAAKSSVPAAAPTNTNTRTVKSRDGSFTGEIVGTPASDSKFAKLLIGMEMTEVQKVVGRFPDELHSFESGKRWIPFYFGNDARRIQVLYKGEGCLVFTGGSVLGTPGGDLIQIIVDASGSCYAP